MTIRFRSRHNHLVSGDVRLRSLANQKMPVCHDRPVLRSRWRCIRVVGVQSSPFPSTVWKGIDHRPEGYGRELFVHDVDACYKAIARTIRVAAQLAHEVSSVRVAADRGGLAGVEVSAESGGAGRTEHDGDEEATADFLGSPALHGASMLAGSHAAISRRWPAENPICEMMRKRMGSAYFRISFPGEKLPVRQPFLASKFTA